MSKYEGKPQLLALYESGRSAAIANAPRSSAPRFTNCDKYARHLGAWTEGFDDEMRKQRFTDDAVNAAFASDTQPVRIPPISDFAREIDRQLGAHDIDQQDFDAAVEALAAEVPCPSLGTLTYAAEFLNDHVLPAYVGDMSDADLNWQAVCAMEFSEEFRTCFAYSYLNSIVAGMNERHARDVRESIRTARAGGE